MDYFIDKINKMWGSLFLSLEKLKGTRTIIEIITPQNSLSHLTGVSISGYEISIYCQKKHYKRIYANWFIPNVDLITYRVFGTVTENAPERLKRACELDLHFPMLLPLFIDDHVQKNAAVDAYLDILIADIESHK